MIIEHSWIGTLALLKNKTISKRLGVPLALFEIFYYTYLTAVISLLHSDLLFSTFTVFFLITHVTGGSYYIFKGERQYGSGFYNAYSIYEFTELAFLLAVFFLFA
ncbi:hypothetical protein [Sulfolobus acidocaldarius]|nr:hypothetical protein [Sulfolobus acidocaldarius]ALU32577.1 hypothetical protein ATZ20_10745 [Sulfolobus acidocaldarius]